MLRYVIKLNCFVLFVLMFICLDTQLKSGVWASGGGPGACLQNMEGRYLSISGGGGIKRGWHKVLRNWGWHKKGGIRFLWGGIKEGGIKI